MASKIRSDTGCWTCRLRRKKCDENRKICLVSSSRGITCHGYIGRPAWMDGGCREKEMAASIRQQLHQRLKQSCQTRAQKSVKCFELPNEAVTPSPEGAPSSTVSNVTGTGIDLSSPSRTRESPVFLQTREPGHSSQDFDCPTKFQTGTPKLGIHEKDSSSPFFPLNATPKLLTIHGSTADLLMHYMNKVFPEQYGIYCSFSPDHQRGWLFLLLMRSQLFLESCLALSAYRLSHVPGHEMESTHQKHFLVASYQHHRSAMALLMEILASEGLNGNTAQSAQKTEILGCVIQLNLLQMLQGGNESWEPLLNTIMTFALPGQDLTAFGLGQGSVPQRLDTIDDSNDPASLFFTGMVIWFDILSCAASKRMPEFSITHRSLMQTITPKIDMRKLMGCENWVLLCILDIIFLDRWKSDQEIAMTLSLIELTSRATVIELVLDEGIRRFQDLTGGTVSAPDEAATMGSISGNEFSADSRSVMRMTTYIFACAAVVYLRTVTAGPNLRAPELRQSVNRGVQAFNLITDFQHIRNLVWPFYIVGSLATREQESLFRTLVSSFGADQQTVGSFSNAFSVVEACWSERWSMDGTLQYCHWNMGMKKLNFYPLLV